MKEVRLGIIGVGNMGQYHANSAHAGKIKRCKLTAVCDTEASAIAGYDGVAKFADSAGLIRSGLVDAVLIATPHYSHTSIGIDALKNGLHLLVEKPLSVHKKDCQRLLAAHTDKSKTFGIMFMTRTYPVWQKLKQMLDAGEIGELQRVSWIITDWYRSDSYYASGSWRATWRGEGGGILTNQCPHNLDMLQWLLGMPVRMRAWCHLGKRHDIEVEDEVTAYFEYKNGATGTFISSTGEAPGANRLEIVGDKGKLLMERGKLSFIRNKVGAAEFARTSPEAYSPPPSEEVEVRIPEGGGAHDEVTQRFVDAILDGTPLIARAEEGINAVELANSMLYSSLTGQTVELPMDADAFEKKLQELIAGSKEKKVVGPKITQVPSYIKQ